MINYKKDFDGWSKVAKRLQNSERPQDVHPGAIYWVNIGVNIGSGEDGKGPKYTRPALVVRKLSDWRVTVVPITTKTHLGRYYAEVMVVGRLETLLFDQMRTIDTKCIGNFIDEVDHQYLQKIRSSLADLII